MCLWVWICPECDVPEVHAVRERVGAPRPVWLPMTRTFTALVIAVAGIVILLRLQWYLIVALVCVSVKTDVYISFHVC